MGYTYHGLTIQWLHAPTPARSGAWAAELLLVVAGAAALLVPGR